MDSRRIQKVYIDLIYYPLRTLGPGERVGVWFQGCTIGCKDCISQHTWEQTEDNFYLINEVITKIQSFNCAKLTISGGEPFQQPDALYMLLNLLRSKFDDILVYSGYTYQHLVENFPDIISLIDVLIDGAYEKELPTSRIYKGSKNQKMYIFNEQQLVPYQIYANATQRRLQIYRDEQKIYVLGIPDSKDTIALRDILKGE